MKRLVLVVLAVASIILALGSMIYAMTKMSASELVMCSANEGGIRIPSTICEYYLKEYRLDKKDLAELAIGGLDPILNFSNEAKKYEIASFLISKGMDVNGVNNFYYERPDDSTPLHLSVLYNDPKRAEFLIKHGANINIQSEYHKNMIPLELAVHFQGKIPNVDRSKIIQILKGH